MLLIIPFTGIKSQNKTSAFKQFWNVSRYEKCWALKHIFVAGKAWKITKYVRQVSDSLAKTNILDGDADGGQVDAFRHAFWMAMLSQNMSNKKALKLGIAHEKGNYLDYKKNRKEEGSLPDKISSDMDLYNNNIGIDIGIVIKNNTNILTTDSLKQIIINNILNGKMMVIKKNKKGEFLDTDNNVIKAESLVGKWENNKVLVPSNYVR
ncbi:MAG: hypothetical protein WCL51_14460 [Bacteroidota bacterium]